MIPGEARIKCTVQQSDHLRTSAPLSQSFTARSLPGKRVVISKSGGQHSEWAKGIWVGLQQLLVQPTLAQL